MATMISYASRMANDHPTRGDLPVLARPAGDLWAAACVTATCCQRTGRSTSGSLDLMADEEGTIAGSTSWPVSAADRSAAMTQFRTEHPL